MVASAVKILVHTNPERYKIIGLFKTVPVDWVTGKTITAESSCTNRHRKVCNGSTHNQELISFVGLLKHARL